MVLLKKMIFVIIEQREEIVVNGLRLVFYFFGVQTCVCYFAILLDY